MGVETSRISSGVVREERKRGKSKNCVPPQQPPMVIGGTMRSSGVTFTSLNVPLTGFELESQKDPIWVAVNHTTAKKVEFTDAKYCNYQDQAQQSEKDIIGTLMETAEEKMRQEALSLGCNSVLGLTFNISRDSTGEHSSSKSVFLTMMGTPCVLLRPSSSTILHPAISTAVGSVEDNPFGDGCMVLEEPLNRKASRRVSYTGGPPPSRVAAMAVVGETIST